MRITTTLAAASASLVMALPALAQAAPPIAGRWTTQDNTAIVTIAPCGRALCGHVTRVLGAAAGKPHTDVNNPNPALRNRPMLGLPILIDLRDAGGDWRGQIYDPQGGHTYKSIVSRNGDGTLKLKGCWSIICRTVTWKPAV